MHQYLKELSALLIIYGKKNFSQIFYLLARVGFTDNWVKEFAQQMISSLQKSPLDLELHPYRAVETLWSMAYYDIKEDHLVDFR